MPSNMIDERYNPNSIEGKWQQVWDRQNTFVAPNPKTDAKNRPKFFCLCMFPYPSGDIHMGHLRNYCIGDVIARFKRMKGFNVMQPPGWDAFGLPAENAAIQRGVHPRDWTLQNIAQMKSVLKAMGIAYDWQREVTTCLPEYYRWEQLFFQRFYREGLAYKKTGTVNWCPNCHTVLANEQVQDGRCWRCDGPATLKELNQWYLKITQYAEELLKGHAELEGKWPERVLDMQKHWIGRSEGCRIEFALEIAGSIEVFTTRPDTLMGVTFVTIAAGHPLAETLSTAKGAKEQLEALRVELAGRTRDVEPEGKKGFFTGSYAIHPITQSRVPIWVGDFVVMDYGTGAVMGVPAHDQRDFDFAKAYQLPIKTVIVPKNATVPLEPKEAFTEAGVLVNSGSFNGMESVAAKSAIGEALEKQGAGKRTVQYRLRDWGISRQRYWGTPIPVIYCDDCGVVLVPEKDLPVQLPSDVKFTGHGNPLEGHTGFVNTKCPTCDKPARRETDTMDTFVESSWYYARYTDARNANEPFSKSAADQWLNVDFYIGGIEHACMHLLYSRFFHKVLRDWGYLSGDEPFARLLSQGMVIKDGAKMSKSKGNVVASTAIIQKYGADTGRLFSLFAAPPEKDLDWNEKGVDGCYRFVMRVWRLFQQFREVMAQPAPAEAKDLSPKLSSVRRKTHWAIKKMSEDIEESKFNTAISAAMELVNEVYALLTEDEKAFESAGGKFVIYEALKNLTLCLSPFSPHLSEELWSVIAGQENQPLASEMPYPTYLPELLQNESFLLVVQVNGKVREKIEVAKGTSKDAIQATVMALPKVQQFMEGKSLKQFIYVPERIANVVVA